MQGGVVLWFSLVDWFRMGCSCAQQFVVNTTGFSRIVFLPGISLIIVVWFHLEIVLIREKN